MQSGNIKAVSTNDKQWTAEQSSAINDDGGTLLISAAAGSGKTAVLVERAVRLMTLKTQPIAADKILIVTFTNAAAQELRSRIGARLAQMIMNEPKNIHLRKQKLLLARANICTMHSFCLQLLQRNFTALNLPADFSIADDAEIPILMQKAIEKTLEFMYTDDDFRAFACMYGKTRSDEGAKNALLALYEFSRSLPSPQEALEKLVDDYKTNLPFGKTIWGRHLLKNADIMVQNAITLTQNAIECVNVEPELSNYSDALFLDLAFYENLQKVISANNWDEAQILTQNFKYASLKALKKGYSSHLAEKVKVLRNKAKAVIKKIQNSVFICTKEQFEEDLNLSYNYIVALCKGASYFSQTFFSIKLEEKVLEYSDLEHLAIKLLLDEKGKKTVHCNQLSNEIKYIMVDEYQDTNAIQDTLYKCLSNDNESNLFFVGDVKQSIYKFRLASPDKFIEKREKFANYSENKYPATIILGHNFRSSINVINQINDVFSLLMSKQVGEICYDKSEQLQLGLQSDFDGGALEFNIIDKSEDDAQQTDVEHVAYTVSSMIKNKYQVIDNGKSRDCRPDDFCVLLRTRAKFPLYAAALSAENIPVHTDSSENFLMANEVGTLLSMLRVIDNPGQDVHLAAVLLSALFGFTPDDLLQIREVSPKGRLYSALLQSSDEKITKFCEILNYLRTVAISTDLFELCSEILNITNYYYAVGAMENGESKRENINLFLSFTTSFSHNTYSSGGLSAFLRRVDSAINNKTSIASSAQPAKNSVSIMTIHRSKGLEFPIVILADTATQFNVTDTRKQFLFHPSMGAGLKLKASDGVNLYQSAMHASIASCAENEIKSEQMRLLYVALTRAKQKIIVTAAMKNPVKTLEDLAYELDASGNNFHLIQNQNTFAHWMCIAALLHKDCNELRKIAKTQIISSYNSGGKFTAKLIESKISEEFYENKIFERSSLPSEELVKEINNNFAKAYNVQKNSYQIPLKLSVTAISHKNSEAVFSRPAFTHKQGLTAAEKGIALHEFLQFANLNFAKANLKQEIKRLVDEEFMSKVFAEKLNDEKIEMFLSSDTAKRMMSAKTLYREYDFLTSLPAGEIVQNLPEDKKQIPITVQGIVDVICVNENGIEIIDYKTDKNKTENEFIKTYKSQLLLYKAAIEKRFEKDVVKCTIYSLEKNMEIDVKL